MNVAKSQATSGYKTTLKLKRLRPVLEAWGDYVDAYSTAVGRSPYHISAHDGVL